MMALNSNEKKMQQTDQDRPTIEEEEEEEFGPAPPNKRQKTIELNDLFLDQLPSAHMYEWSYMHRDQVTHILVTPHTYFVITASKDGVVKFWKKSIQHQLQFVKEYKAHIEPITSISCTLDGTLMCSCSPFDHTIKVFDVVTFDMINVLKFKPNATDSKEYAEFKPYLIEFIAQKQGSAKMALLAVCDNILNEIRIYDVNEGDPDINAPLYCYKSIHSNTDNNRILQMKYNEPMNTVITIDKKGIIEYWDPFTGKMPSSVKFHYKTETDLYEFAKNKTHAVSLCISKNGEQFVTMGRDRMIRIFDFSTGKLKATFDETLAHIAKLQQSRSEEYAVEDIDFGRRLAIEKEIEKQMDLIYENVNHKLVIPVSNVIFDDSGHFIIYPTLLGIKIVNIITNKMDRLLGKVEHTERFLGIALFQGTLKISRAELAKMDAKVKIENTDPTIFCCAYKKNRFYSFSRREPSEEEGTARDIFNEKPSKEDMEVAALNISSASGTKGKLAKIATIHTTFGDIHIRLFGDKCPKAVENFTRLSQEGYYNGVIFHRVIRNFMIQTGDPEGDGTGGTSCWGRDFEDEFHPSLRHDAPFKVSMANAGPNTNGSQFFITTVPTPWLDDKHTLFGEVIRGQDVVKMIEQVRTDKNEKPREEIKIINIDLQF
jgi:peptidylprolyl isomerase domain and WD repeat-containing protein 1